MKRVSELFPSCTPSYDFFGGGKGYSEYQSTTEKFGILQAERSGRIDKLDGVIDRVLTDVEKEVIHIEFFEPTRHHMYLKRMGWTRWKFQEVKKRALLKLAQEVKNNCS